MGCTVNLVVSLRRYTRKIYQPFAVHLQPLHPLLTVPSWILQVTGWRTFPNFSP